ncbi:3-oxoacyl-[acyl-carrier-protein] synthase III C-terminal domain-containing protein [Actinomadura nitritigenes]|uniref:3-oxoacyl-[acyl-carrier-protein] synthase III C-terminal domain-containing protein n=1 Tax=Actinomadura nitritigenes TaxID=134602 RepID=UPI0036B5509A
MLSGSLTLDAVASHFPERTVTVEERAAELGLNAAQTHLFRRIQGLDRMRIDPEMDLYDLLLPAAREALAAADPRSVRYLIYVHAAQEIGPSTVDPAREIRDALGLRDATAFALTHQSCAGGLSAIDTAGALLQADGDPSATALIVAGEKNYSRGTQVIYNACLLAEGSAACLVSWNGPGDPVRSFVARTHGEHSRPQRVQGAVANRIPEDRATLFGSVMKEAAARAGCDLADIQTVISTNSNIVFLGDMTQYMEFRPGMVFMDNVPRYSHCLAADPFINYVTLRDEKRLEPGRHQLFWTVGVGMTLAAMVITHVGGDR